MSLDTGEKVAVTGLCVGVVLLIVAVALAPYLEARAFNKFRGPNQPKATYLDALSAELRVDTANDNNRD